LQHYINIPSGLLSMPVALVEVLHASIRKKVTKLVSEWDITLYIIPHHEG